MDATVTERVGRMRSGRRAWSAISLFSAMLMAMGLSLYSAQPAYATIVTNGGFEATDFSGWTQFGNLEFSGVECVPDVSPAQVAEGNCAASFGPTGDTGGISQELTLHVGTHYLLSFDFMPDGGIPSSFSVSLGGVLLSLDDPPGSSGYQTYTFDVFATSALENLVFTFRDDPGFLLLDAVSLVIPEPGTIALLAIGLAGLLVMGLRRKTQ
jgi:PEP-CTERM motif